MTEYCATFTVSISGNGATYNGSALAALQANVNSIRIIQIEVTSAYASNSLPVADTLVRRYNNSGGAAISGGSTIPIAALRSTSDPAKAVVRYQTGTYTISSSYSTGPAVTVPGTPFSFGTIDKTPWRPPGDLTLDPGSSLVLTGYPATSSSKAFLLSFRVWFDEEHTARSG